MSISIYSFLCSKLMLSYKVKYIIKGIKLLKIKDENFHSRGNANEYVMTKYLKFYCGSQILYIHTHIGFTDMQTIIFHNSSYIGIPWYLRGLVLSSTPPLP